jgi:hypothetical protein
MTSFLKLLMGWLPTNGLILLYSLLELLPLKEKASNLLML